MASSSKEVQEKSENEQLQKDISESLIDVIHRRSEVPPRLKRVQAKILKHEESQAENLSILPSSEIKKVGSKYSLKKPLPEEHKISKEMPNQSKELPTRVEELSENQAGVKKAMLELLKKKK